jgi:hypothetical protein
MKVKSKTKLSIFDTFKTKENTLTGEAMRQRFIIQILSSKANPAEKTRTGISQKIAKGQGNVWKNIYSGIFRDLDEILIPMGIAEEDGRLPLKRGPKALQEIGMPFYHLTRKGVLIALSIKEVENKEMLLKEFFSKADSSEKYFERIVTDLSKTSPVFIYSIFRKYVKAFCEDKIKELLPFDFSKLQTISDESLIIQKEFLGAFVKLSKDDKGEALKFLHKIT